MAIEIATDAACAAASEGAGRAERPPLRPEHLRAVRLGHGANCSSVGSVVDTLFLSAAAGAAIFAAVCAAIEAAPRAEPNAEPEPEPEPERDG